MAIENNINKPSKLLKYSNYIYYKNYLHHVNCFFVTYI